MFHIAHHLPGGGVDFDCDVTVPAETLEVTGTVWDTVLAGTTVLTDFPEDDSVPEVQQYKFVTQSNAMNLSVTGTKQRTINVTQINLTKMQIRSQIVKLWLAATNAKKMIDISFNYKWPIRGWNWSKMKWWFKNWKKKVWRARSHEILLQLLDLTRKWHT